MELARPTWRVPAAFVQVAVEFPQHQEESKQLTPVVEGLNAMETPATMTHMPINVNVSSF